MTSSTSIHEVRIIPIPIVSEIRAGNSVPGKILRAMTRKGLTFASGDILMVKHKIISKAEGQIVDLATISPSIRSQAWARKYHLDARVVEIATRESKRIVRRKRGILITETRHGFICANSGVDVSNVDGGKSALLLPRDPDASATLLHQQIKKELGLFIPVIITDSFGRPWREGLTEVAIGLAGMNALFDYRTRLDSHRYVLQASVEAVVDELACAAGLVCGKLSRTPACIIRGFRYQRGQGRGRDLLRNAANDLFR